MRASSSTSRRLPDRRAVRADEGRHLREAARLDAIDDDLETIGATGEVSNALDDAILAIGEPRLRAIARLRADGWSYTDLVDATGLSKTRVAQLVHEARARGIR